MSDTTFIELDGKFYNVALIQSFYWEARGTKLEVEVGKNRLYLSGPAAAQAFERLQRYVATTA